MPTAQEMLEISNAPKVKVVKRPARRFLFKVERALSPIAKKSAGRADRFFKAFATKRKQQLIYSRDVKRPIIGSGLRKVGSGRGRPRGSYDQRYKNFGGVYGYRKMLNAQLRMQKLQALQQATISPQQQNVINQFELQQRMQQMNPENRPIPSTTGEVRLKNIHDEIADACNIVP